MSNTTARTSPGLQIAVMLIGVLVALIVAVLVGRFVSDVFGDMSDKMNQIQGTTVSSTR